MLLEQPELTEQVVGGLVTAPALAVVVCSVKEVTAFCAEIKGVSALELEAREASKELSWEAFSGESTGGERKDCQVASRTLDAGWHEVVVGHG